MDVDEFTKLGDVVLYAVSEHLITAYCRRCRMKLGPRSGPSSIGWQTAPAPVALSAIILAVQRHRCEPTDEGLVEVTWK
jgi:hypothetical protein